jgi:hypothetical protein
MPTQIENGDWLALFRIGNPKNLLRSPFTSNAVLVVLRQGVVEEVASILKWQDQ